MGLLLDLVYLLVSVLASPWIAYRLTSTRSWATVPRRLGIRLPAGLGDCIWLHASSVGEVALLKPLVARLELAFPRVPIVVSTFTRTGQEAAQASFRDHTVIYLPLDLSFVVTRFLHRLEPRLLVIVESELWPNLLGRALDRGVSVVVLNGKMSARSARVHARARLVARQLDRLAVVAVQNERHAERFRALGVSEARLRVTGNMKYDLAGPGDALAQREALRASLGLTSEDVVVIGGSLHEGEDAALLDACAALADGSAPEALILVPRYPEQARGVVERVRRHARRAVLQTDIDAGRAEPPGREGVLVVDVIGRLGGLYAAADVAFVGGSLFYRGPGKGGHNLMEPAILGVPVLFGPYNVSFSDTVDDLLAADAGVCVESVEEMVAALRHWVADPTSRRAAGKRAKAVIERGKGATERNFELLSALPCLAGARLQGSPDPSTMPPAARDSELR